MWLSSVRPDGSPHVLPVWFVWDGDAILFYSKPHAQKVRNLQASPRVMFAVGDPGADFDVELVEATADLLPPSGPAALPEAFARSTAA